MRRFDRLAAVASAVGEPLGHSAWHEVTQAEVSAFADVTGDHYWIHTDEARAAAGPFGSTIAHGMLTLSLVPRLAAEVYAIDGLQLKLNYGLNKVRFPATTPVGSRIRAHVEIVAVVPGPKGTQVTTRVVVEREGSARPVCVADLVVLCVE